MTAPPVFITTSPLHVLYSACIARKMGLGDYRIHWFGKEPFERLALAELLRDEPVLDLTHLEMNSFRGFLRDADRYLEETVPAGASPELLFTCYDTHYAFETLRRRRGVPWKRTGIIEDGSANYFPHAMPRRRWQPVKSLAARAARGHFLHFSWNNLGGNRRMGFVSTLSPEHVYVVRGSHAEIVGIAGEVRALLDERGLDPPALYREAGAILFLPAVIHYRRLDEHGVRAYVREIAALPTVAAAGPLVVKPHPRENVAALRRALAPDGVAVGGDEPIEIYLSRLDVPVWAGSPSTAMLNNRFLYPEREARYVLLPLAGNPLLPDIVRTFARLLDGAAEFVPARLADA